jgi:hypothetical protein
VVIFGPPLRIDETAGVTIVRWRRLGLLDIAGFVVVPLAVIWGAASALGAEEILDMRVIPMSAIAAAIYWTVVAGLALHLALNRTASLRIEPGKIHYRGGRVLARQRTLDSSGGVRVQIDTREDAIAESFPDGRSPSTTTLQITAPPQAPIVITDLSEESAREVERLVTG